jgi:hypothetical protein
MLSVIMLNVTYKLYMVRWTRLEQLWLVNCGVTVLLFANGNVALVVLSHLKETDRKRYQEKIECKTQSVLQYQLKIQLLIRQEFVFIK